MMTPRAMGFDVLARVLALVFTAAAVAVLYFWFAAVQLIMERQPDAVELGQLRIKGPADPAGGADVTIGRDDLMQKKGANAAEAAHIRAIYADGAWSVANAAESRRLTLRYSSGAAFDSARWKLAENDSIVLRSLEATAVIHVAELRDRAAVLVSRDIAKPDRETAVELEFAGADARILRAGGANVYKTCGGRPSLVTSFKRSIQGALGASRDGALAEMGGSVFCSGPGEPARIAIPGAPGGLIRLIRRDGDFFIVPGEANDPAAARVLRNARMERGETSQLLRAMVHPLAHPRFGQLVELTAGRTDYAVSQDGADLVLTPVKNVHWFRKDLEGEAAGAASGVPALAKDKPVERTEKSRPRPRTLRLGDIWEIPAAAWRAPPSVLALAALVSLAFLSGSMISAWRGREPFALVQNLGVGLAVTGAACLYTLDERALQAFGPANALALVLAIWLLATWLVWRARGRSCLGPLLWLLIAALAAMGNIVLAQLGFGADNTRWLGYFERALAPLAMFGAGAAAAMALGNGAWLELAGHAASGPGIFSRAGFRRGAAWPWWVRVFPILLTFGFLAIWLTFGEEEGIGGLVQPSEFIKIGVLYLVCAAFATAYTRIVVDADAEVQAWGVIGMVALVAALLLVFLLAPIVQHDFSPLVIIAGTMAAVVIAGGFVAFLNQTAHLAARRDRLPPREFFGRPPRRSWSWLRFDSENLRRWGRDVRNNGARILARSLFFLACAAMAVAVWRASSYVDSWLGDPAAIERADACRGGESADDSVCALMNIGFWSRVLSYLDMRLDKAAGGGVVNYPDEGRQVQLSRRSVAGAACLPPFDGLPLAETLEWASAPLRALCARDARAPRLGDPNPEDTMAAPVVQNDFIGGFVIGRFGEAAGAFVILLQGLISAIALCLAVRVYRVWPGNEEDRARRHFLSLVCLGAGALFALQWSLAWANAFGALPVMGQPMTFVSSAGSHVVLFALPLTVALLVTVRVEQEPAGVIGPADLPRAPWWAAPNHWWRRGAFIER